MRQPQIDFLQSPEVIPDTREHYFSDKALLREPNLWTPGKKPVGPVKVDMSHPITKDLSAYFCPTPNNRGIDLVNKQLPSAMVGHWEATSEGLGWRTDADGDYIRYDSHPNYELGSADFTLWHNSYMYGSVAGQCGMIGKIAGTAGAAEWGWICRGDDAEGEPRIFHYGNNTDIGSSNWPSTEHPGYFNQFLVGHDDGDTTYTYETWISDYLYETTSPATAITPSSSTADFLIGDITDAFVNAIDAVHLCCGIWHRALSETEVRSLQRDPYQFLVPA